MNFIDKRPLAQSKNEDKWISLFSHHPPCKHFKEHTFRMGGKEFCIGCYIGYPSGMVGIIITILILHFQEVKLLPFLSLTLSGLILSFIPSLLKLTFPKKIKILQKLGLGIFGGSFLVVVYNILPLSPLLKGLNTFFIFNIIMAPILLKHYFKMRNTCDRCPDKWNPEICPIKYCLAKRSEPNDLINLETRDNRGI